MTNDLAGVKVGDKLFVSNRWNKYIVTADRVTPSGRVITSAGEFNPNGHKRGDSGWDRSYARLASEDDIAGIFRLGLVRKLEAFRTWDKLNAEDLMLVAKIVDKYKLPASR